MKRAHKSDEGRVIVAGVISLFLYSYIDLLSYGILSSIHNALPLGWRCFRIGMVLENDVTAPVELTVRSSVIG
jgi:hypothetical protein